MSLLVGVLGGALVVLVLADAVVTTLSMVTTTGPVSGRVARGVWRLFLAAGTRSSRGGILRWSGTCTLLATFLTWAVLLWAGWFLVFTAYESAVVASTTSTPAGGWDRVYFTGYTLFTLGIGDYIPDTAWAQVATVLASLSGLFLVTLSLTYLVQVIQAVVHKREVAEQIHALGQNARHFIAQGWTGSGFSSMFNQQLVSLTAPLLRLGEQHLAFPVVHYFHSVAPQKAPARAMATLGDALLLLDVGTASGSRPDPAAIGPLGRALDQVLENLRGQFFSPAKQEESRPVPPLSVLRQVGVPTVGEEEYADRVRQYDGRRRAVQGFLHSDGWRDGPSHGS
ncbi:potassium channel family protein [Streptomyces nanhaiensis]|uniref:potassium channel family protein n=1 Tax=Streptomyces nanhaiensis TaxID=679319 RepID=UPI00399CA8D2